MGFIEGAEKFATAVLGLLEKKPRVIAALGVAVAAAVGVGIVWPHRFANWTAWFAAIAVGLVTLALALVTPDWLSKARTRNAIRKNPPKMSLTAHSGRRALVEIVKSGHPAEVHVRARTIDTHIGPNPRPEWWPLEPYAVDANVSQVTLAEFIEGYNAVPLYVLRSPFGDSEGIATVEVAVSTVPPMAEGEIVRRFLVSRAKQLLTLLCIEESDAATRATRRSPRRSRRDR